jgi:Tol biopolymer transport system component
MAGGAPRQVLDEVPVGGADWSPDGRNLVVMHLVGDTFRLESPIGKVIAVGAFGFPRFSADGNMISFWEQSGRSNSVGVIDRFGKSKKILSADWTEISGVPCWSAKGRDIWFTAGKKGERPALWRVDLSGRLRLAIRVPGSLELDDISSDGRVLLTHHTALQSVRGLGPGQSRESDLSWLDGPLPADLSQDGSMLLLNEDGDGRQADDLPSRHGRQSRPAALRGRCHGTLARQAAGARRVSCGRREAVASRPASYRPRRAQGPPDRKARAVLGRIHSGWEARGLFRLGPG